MKVIKRSDKTVWRLRIQHVPSNKSKMISIANHKKYSLRQMHAAFERMVLEL